MPLARGSTSKRVRNELWAASAHPLPSPFDIISQTQRGAPLELKRGWSEESRPTGPMISTRRTLMSLFT